ncbi:MAG: TrmH family RNA methyltransferase [Saccharofermentanales bacterium]
MNTTKKVLSKNADYQKFEVLKTNRNKRYKYQEFLVEGVRNINEAVKNGWRISSFIYTKEKPLSGWADNLIRFTNTDINYETTIPLIEDLSGKEDTSEILAIIKMRDDDISKVRLSKNPLLALFDRPSNKGNLGTIIRSCDALGVDGLILTGHSVDLYDIDVIVPSMGSFFKVPVIRMPENNDTMKTRYPDFKVIGTTAHSQTNLYDIDLTTPLMFMIGNETDGLSKTFTDYCDVLATIPMCENSSASSLNVGCAATVFFYEASRQRS